VSINDRFVTSRTITLLTLIATHKGNFPGSAPDGKDATFGTLCRGEMRLIKRLDRVEVKLILETRERRWPPVGGWLLCATRVKT
jgi:hypothetical protein